jgi:Ca2+-binding RTX toxin-like protein
MGGTGSDRGAAVKYTPERDILLTGSFSGTGNFNPRSAAVNLVSSGGTDAFTARYDGAMFLKWAAKAGGTLNDTGTDIEADPTGRVVTIGNFDGTVDFDPSAATLELVSRGSSDGFVATYAAFGGLQSVQHIGGSRNDSLRSLEMDAAGNRYLAGRAENLIHFGRGNGSFSFRSAGAGDIFITKLTPADAFVYVQQLQGSSDAAPGGIALGPDSTLSLAGTFLGSMDTNPNFGAHHLSSLTSGAVIMQLSPDLTISDPVDNLGVRRNGDLLQIVRLNEEGGFNGVIEDGLLAETHSVSLDRTVAGDSRFMQVDFATGGAFTLPGGIQLAGSTNSGVTDTVHILGTGVEAVTVRPSATTHKSATVLAHNQVIALTGVEAMVTAGSQALFVEAPKSGSVWTVNQGPGLYGPGGTRVEGSSGGVEILRIGFVDVPSVTLSTERPIESLSAAADTITVTALALEAAGLKNLFVRTGRGDDTLIVNGPDLSLPTAGGAFWYLGGPGSDRLTAIADTNLDLNDARLVSGGGGRIQFDDIEKASLTGGAGNNHLNASLFTGDVTLDGAAGADLLRGGSGNDVLFGGTGNDRLFGNDGNDVLNGQDNNDLLFGGNGLDTLNGQNGNDRLYGDEDDDFLNGGANNDVLLGGNGNDTLFGGTEDDLLFGEAGDDILNGEAGNDQLDFGSDNDTGNGGAGNDLYLLYGTQNAEDLQLARNSATSATFRRKPRGLTSSLESKGITMDATDEFFIQALDGDDLIAIDTAFTQLGSVDGGNGSDTCTAPGAWTKVSC